MPAVAQDNMLGLYDWLWFKARSAGLKLRRFGKEMADPAAARRHPQGSRLIDNPALAEARSPLWSNVGGQKERALTAGKVHNLRLALQGIDGIEVPAGEVFSFWRQVGRPSRRRGFVDGRELREGCLIASTGGGLCQLSNALYDAALRAGFDIAERHAHSRRVKGSKAALGRDATVFWNYVDLRFRSARPFRIEARMTSDELIVTFRGAASGEGEAVWGAAAEGRYANDCLTCGQSACARNDPERPAQGTVPTAWLVDACTPEFSSLFVHRARPIDVLMLPTRRYAKGRYGWPVGRCGSESEATLATIRRSLELRNVGQGGVLQARALSADARLAAAFAARLSHLDTRLVVAQNLLPHLWRQGVLQGRTFSVLMDRLPIDALQARLDAAARLYPQSRSLGDFRAPAKIAAAEKAALGAAERLFTAHPEIAACHAEKTTLLDWAPGKPLNARRGGKTVLFPASALARKGVYALREAIASLDLDLVIAGQVTEARDFWAGLPARVLGPGEWPNEIAVVVLPAIVEHQPRALLAALAAGIPVIATPACGLKAQPGLTLVPAIDASALREALEACLKTRNKPVS